MFVTTQAIALALTLYIYIIWSIHHRLDSSTDNIFAFATGVAMLSQASDIMCQLVMSGVIETSETIIGTVIDFYLASIPLYVLAIALYVANIIYDTKTYAICRSGIFAIAFVSSIIMIILPGTYTYHPSCSIPEGPSVLYTYVISMVFSVALLILLLKNRKAITKWKFLVSLTWVCLFLAGGFSQFLLINTYNTPIVSLMIAIGILVLYLIIENPGNRFDYEHNCFHYDAFIDYVNEILVNKEVKSVLYLNLVFKNNEFYDYVDEVFNDLIKTHEKNNKIRIFRGHHDEIMITARDYSEIQYFGKTILDSINKTETKLGTFDDYQASIVLIPSLEKIIDFMSLRSLFDSYDVRKINSTELIEVYTIDDTIVESFNRESSLVSELDDAIKKDKVFVNYQTIHSDSNEDVINVEAQVSIKTNDDNLLTTKEYLYVAEKYNKFMQIDEMALKNVCNTISRLERIDNKLGVVFVRVSVQVLESENFVKRFVSILNNYNVSLSKICLEITNADAISQKDLFINNLNSLKKHGVTLAIGGFGSGESNLNYFIDLPIDYVKYDPSMLINSITDDKALMIMKEVTNLAHDLGFKVISVGVENEESMKIVKDCSIDLTMGKYVSHNYSYTEFINFVLAGGSN